MRSMAVAAALFVLAAPDFSAQAPAPSNPGGPAFEVASVKPNPSGSAQVMIGIPPGTGRFNATNVPLRFLIRFAYSIQDFQITGGPGWINSDRFDIVARAPEGQAPQMLPGTTGPFQLMLRALLTDRFKLAVHTETREMPIYALVLARNDGKTGANLRPAAADCAKLMAARQGGPPPAPPQPGEPIPCGFMIGVGTMNVGGMPLSQLATTLSPQVGRIVVDRTGLTGNYDFQLEFAPEQRGLPGLPPPAGPPGPNEPPIPSDRPSIFTALQEQLGLKLESTRGPIEVLVIDSVDQPTPD